MKRIIALIPARERSVRIKNKNLKKICKQPLIWWTLEAAKKSKYVDEIYVSSDSLKILDYLKKKNNFFDYLIYLQPTSPLRTNHHIDYALNKILKKKISGLVSVSRQSDENLWKLKVKNNKVFNNVAKNKNFVTRSQDLKKIYKPNGAIFIFNLKKLKYKSQFDISKGFEIYEMDRLSSIDIDDHYDFNLADLVLKNRNGKN